MIIPEIVDLNIDENATPSEVLYFDDYAIINDQIVILNRNDPILPNGYKLIGSQRDYNGAGFYVSNLYYLGTKDELIANILPCPYSRAYYLDSDGEIIFNHYRFSEFDKDKIINIVIPDGTLVVDKETLHIFRNSNFKGTLTLPHSIEKIDFAYNNNIKEIYYDGSFEDWCQVEGYNKAPGTLYIKGEDESYTTINIVTISNDIQYIPGPLEYIHVLKEVTEINDVLNGGYLSSEAKVLYDGTFEDWININFVYEKSNPMDYAREGELYFLDDNGDLIFEGNRYSRANSIVYDYDVELRYQLTGLTQIDKVIIPASTTYVSSLLFGRTQIIQLIIPETVTEIDRYYDFTNIYGEIINLSSAVINLSIYSKATIVNSLDESEIVFHDGFVTKGNSIVFANTEVLYVPDYIERIEDNFNRDGMVKEIYFGIESKINYITRFGLNSISILEIPNLDCVENSGLSSGTIDNRKINVLYDGDDLDEFVTRFSHFYHLDCNGEYMFNGKLYSEEKYYRHYVNNEYILDRLYPTANIDVENIHLTYDLVQSAIYGREVLVLPHYFTADKNAFNNLGNENNMYYNVKYIFYKGSIEEFIQLSVNINFSSVTGFYYLDDNGDTYFGGNYYSLFKEWIVSEDIHEIPDDIFDGLKCLESVVFHESVYRIGKSAFMRCTNLEKIVFLNQDIEIEDGAFCECPKITDIQLTEIKNYNAFLYTPFAYDNYYTIDGVTYFGNVVVNIDKDLEYVHFAIPNYYIDKYSLGNVIGQYPLEKALYIGPIYNPNTYYMFNLPLIQTLEIVHTNEDFIIQDRTIENIIVRRDYSRLSSSGIIKLAIYLENIVNIYFEEEEEDLRWMNKVYPDWNRSLSVYYKGEWATAMFYNENGLINYYQVHTTEEVIRQPIMKSYNLGAKTKAFIGYDLNDDGIPDFIPSTNNRDIVAKAIYSLVDTTFKVKYYDFDSNLIRTDVYNYGDIIKPIDGIEKVGYIFLGWDGYSEGLIAKEDCYFISLWKHNGNGHEYIKTTILPTCEEDGYDYYECSICHHTYKDNIVSKLGHTYSELVIDDLATCEHTGKGHYTCNNCHETHYIDLEILEHQYQLVEKKESTCTEEGYNKYKCVDCGNEYIEYIPMLAHNYGKIYTSYDFIQTLLDMDSVMYGHDDLGYYYYACLECGDISILNSKKAAVQVVHEHLLGDEIMVLSPNCMQEGIGCIYCQECNKLLKLIYIPKTDHNLIHHDALNPTCTEHGYYAYDECKDCDYSTYQEINALGHDLVHYDALAPTCSEHGYDAYDECKRCDYTTYHEISALGHTHSEVVIENVIASTCTTSGSHDEVIYCTVCHEEILRTHKEVDALGHDLVHHDALAPTCSEHGYDAYDECKRCDYTTYHEISALGHDLVHHEGKDATCIEKGYKAYDACSRCNYSTYEELPALGHNYSFSSWTWLSTSEAMATFVCTNDNSHILNINSTNITSEITSTPTVYENGLRVYTAKVTFEGVEYSDQNEEIIPSLSHDYQYTWNYILLDGVYSATLTITDENDDTFNEVVTNVTKALTSHQDATCTENGYNTYVFSAKGTVGILQSSESKTEVILALGHNYQFSSFEWSEDGKTALAVYICTNDNEHVVKYNATVTSTVKTQPTCLDKGTTTYTATYDNHTESIDKVDINALGHTQGQVVIENNVDPTCTTKGSYDEVIYCTLCHEEISRTHKEVDALGHDFGEWVVIKEATYTDTGLEERKCNRCGEVESRVIDRLVDENITLFSNKVNELDLSKYDNLIELITLYNTLEDKESVSKEISKLIEAINNYNDKIEVINNSANTVNDITLSVFGIINNFSLLGYIWFNIVKKEEFFI